MVIIQDNGTNWIEAFYFSGSVADAAIVSDVLTLTRSGTLMAFSCSKLTGSGVVAFQALTGVSLTGTAGIDLPLGTKISDALGRRSNDSGAAGFLGAQYMLWMRASKLDV